MFDSLFIKFSENQGVWACAVVNDYENYFLEIPALSFEKIRLCLKK